MNLASIAFVPLSEVPSDSGGQGNYSRSASDYRSEPTVAEGINPRQLWALINPVGRSVRPQLPCIHYATSPRIQAFKVAMLAVYI